MDTAERLRRIPSVDRLLSEPVLQALLPLYGHRLVVTAARETLNQVRQEVRAGAETPAQDLAAARAAGYLESYLIPTLRPVINATGVIIHTNLGRAPLSAAACAAVTAAAQSYSNLEYDLASGGRGERSVHAERLLCELTDAEAAIVVNNNAGAVLLALTGLARGRGVVISRGQLVEVGGGFRIPDVMLQSGARLIEVGATNRTHHRDYERALVEEADVALIMRAHPSNFRIVGFTADVSLAELIELGQAHGVQVLDDLGSGALLETAVFGLGHEPMVQDSIAAGAPIVCFSGDKLLGGPQAGILVGKESVVAPLRHHPLARALRADKLCLAALQATLMHYLRDEATREIPVWRMIAAPLDELERRARRWQRALHQVEVAAEVVDGRATIGGGSLPGETLPTRLLALSASDPDRLATALRAGKPPVVARVEEGQLVFDPRTVLEEEDNLLLSRLMLELSGATTRQEEET